MGKRLLSVIVCLFLLASVSACKKKEQAKKGMPEDLKAGLQIVVPDAVKGKWDGVRITVRDKGTNKSEEITIKLNGENAVPKTNLKIKVGEFIPDYKMEGLTITSASNDPNNPAVQVTVHEDEKEIFMGWLYSKFPEVQPFKHDKYAITLKEGIKKH
jgi:hypothetical protein